ncbi:gluconate 2-dehydrogenase subunit 3 family protein [Methylomonas sp. LL1]|uniref:gluconate 2-dehydrogenase subunit 3 family protein n=1 Tax=Methylomonas sp. LL1 TaxID=2785785 RepID=UPI0018C42BFF|nr:gluconate 2-dehydrogenase subunit 3 family protein [Methylomonas sp. LL1]QPK65201.1 gluconate 2-dehydrogenase subunit 3 family protein [Methylomonas sp. LL1]
MKPISINKESQYVFNHCTKYLARSNDDPRHNFGQFTDNDPAAKICESWRFPIIDSYSDGIDFEVGYGFNAVTFIYPDFDKSVGKVAVIGDFANLYEPLPLSRVGDSCYHALTLVIPKGRVHNYQFLVDGNIRLDPINPQTATLENGKTWSRFFTESCTVPLSFERWEMVLLDRLTDHILPFRTAEGENFLTRFYESLDRSAKNTQFAHAYRLDQSVGAVNFIDKLLARSERHFLDDYHICLDIIDNVLRMRNPVTEIAAMPRDMFVDIYNDMASGVVPGWNYARYSDPRFFLKLLRRHTLTGAFAHPKYGGNSAASGWAYLAERYSDPVTGTTLFDWRRAIEKPLGDAPDYHG